MELQRRNFLKLSLAGAGAAALATAAGGLILPGSAQASTTLLKGIGYADEIREDVAFPGDDINGWARLQSINPDWWYNWNQHRNDGTGSNYVPMLYSDSTERLATLDADLASCNMPRYILGFNEPDLVGQAEMSPDEAIALWPTLERAAAVESLKIGAPVTISPDNWWFQEFWPKAMAKGLKIDFIPLHIYTNPDVANTLRKVDNVWNKYGKPIWITETAVADFTATKGIGTAKSTKYTRTQVNDYMEGLWVELKKRPYVHRFAWKTRNVNDNQMWFSALFNDDGSLTGTGLHYRDLV